MNQDAGSSNEINLRVGDPAPDFTLPTHNEGELNLSWYQGRKNVVLAFYPADWTPVCSTQIPSYSTLVDRFEELNTQVLGISVDSVPCHMAWAKSLGGVSYPLFSDFYPHGAVSRKYGVLNGKGFSERSVFVIDKNGIIRFIQRVHPAKLPDNKELLKALEELEADPDNKAQQAEI